MILTGDFNVLPDDESLSGINSLLLSARFSAPVADTIGSYNGYSKDNSVYKPIDYIYYNGFTCERFCIDTTTYLSIPFISDHYPVYADLRW